VLTAVADTWRTRRDDTRQAAARIAAALATRSEPVADRPPSADDLTGAVAVLAQDFDRRHGGFGGAPKFPPAMVCEFLLRHHARTADPGAVDLASRTLAAMARGGLYDQLAGGFARYSVDAGWVVPHFEKMLYDNALLLRVYAHWWRATGTALAARVVDETAAFLLRDLRTAEGGFASSLDADAAGVEGRTYVWTPDELAAVLGPADARWAADLLAVTAAGTVEDGASTLQLRADPPDALRWAGVRTRLLAARSRRPQPARDDKVVAAWNGLAIAALAESGALFDRPEWVEAARSAATLLVDVHLGADGRADRLVRTSRDGVAGRPAGVLEDQADVAEGLLALAAATGEEVWMHRAGALLDAVLDRFVEPSGGFFDTADDAERLVRRPRDPTDGATPSGASAAAGALLAYAALTGSLRHREAAERALAGAAALARRAPRFAGWWLAVAEALADGPREVAVVGDPSDPATRRLAHAARLGTAAGLVLALGAPGSAATAGPQAVPLLRDRPLVDGVPTAYVCRGFVCDVPTSDVAVLGAAVGVHRPTLRVRPFDATDAAAVAGWRYPGRLATYDADAPPPVELYVAVEDASTRELVGFGCVGAEARVPGQAAHAAVLDVGLGLRPDLVGRGLGARLGAVVLDHVRAHATGSGAQRLRVAVLGWNTASLALCARLGFQPSGEVENDEGRFVLLERGVE
jgi:hypothetical protein